MTRAADAGGQAFKGRIPSGTRARLALVLVCFVVLVVSARAAVIVWRLPVLEDRRAEWASLENSVAEGVIANADEYAQGIGVARRIALRRGGRFAVVFGPDVTPYDRRVIRLVTGATFLPAFAVSEVGRADTLIAIGRTPTADRDGFVVIERSGDVWIGGRTR